MRNRLLSGAMAGLIGGIPFGLMMQMMGSIKMIAGMLNSQSSLVGWVIHLMISTFIGASFALLLRGRNLSSACILRRGLLYGGFWWLLGPLTLMPLMAGMSPDWSLAAFKMMLPSLLGHLLFGGVMGWTYARLADTEIVLSAVEGN